MDQRIIDLYDAYTHGGLGRREFLDHLNRSAGSTAAAGVLLAALTNDYALASLVPEDDPRLRCETVAWDAAGARMSGYLSRLRTHERRPAVIVVHENRGLNPHIRDVARRLASEGFLALAPDALSPLGGTPADEDRARELIGALDPVTTVARLAAAVPLLAGHGESNGRVGAVGFCWGGGMVNRLASAGTSLAAAVAYYGQTLPPEDVPRINVPLLLHYAGNDERINAGMAPFEAALRTNGKSYQLFVYEGAQHAFNNDTNAARYDKVAADLAWGRTLAFLRQQLAANEGTAAR